MLRKCRDIKIFALILGLLVFMLPQMVMAADDTNGYRFRCVQWPKSGIILEKGEVKTLEMGSAVKFELVKNVKGRENRMKKSELDSYQWSMSLDGKAYPGIIAIGESNERGAHGELSIYAPLGYTGRLRISGHRKTDERKLEYCFEITNKDLYDTGNIFRGTMYFTNAKGQQLRKEMSNLTWDAGKEQYESVLDPFPWSLPKGWTFKGWEYDSRESRILAQPGQKVIFTEQPTVTAVISYQGWVLQADGWHYYRAGQTVKDNWVKDGRFWYFMDGNGVMKTGWQHWKGDWYYLNSDGSMATSWKRQGKTWYYLQANGKMKTGWLQAGDDWYYLRANGSMGTGWFRWRDHWYYCYKDGRMASNTWVDGYYVDSNGAWQKNPTDPLIRFMDQLLSE